MSVRVCKKRFVSITYRWQISVWLDDDAEWNTRVFTRLIGAWNPVSSAPHERLISVEKCIVNPRILNDRRLLLNLLLLERLLHSVGLRRLLGARIRSHICILILLEL